MSYNSGSGRGYDIPPLDNNGSNYDDWKFKVSALLRMKGLMGIARGTEKCPPQTAEDPKDQDAVTAAFDRWHAWNDEAFGEIIMTVKKGYTVDFGVNNCEIRKDGNAFGIAERKLGLWVLKGTTLSPDHQSAHIATTSLHMWHKRLGHAMTRSIRKLSDQSMVTGLEITNEETTDADEHCNILEDLIAQW